MFDPTEEAPGDTTSVDASKPGIQKAWDAWTSRPENNAALLQFGLSMLQPHSPGQTALGAAANSIGEGGQAAGRVIATQRAEDAQSASEEDKKHLRETQRMTAEGSLLANKAYARNLEVNGGNGRGTNLPLAASLRAQQGFRTWLQKNEDISGLAADPILGAVQKQFPDVKTKADLLNNPAAKAAAYRIYSSVSPEAGEPDTGMEPATTVPVAPQPAAPRPRRYNDKGQAVEWNGTQWTPVQPAPAQ